MINISQKTFSLVKANIKNEFLVLFISLNHRISGICDLFICLNLEYYTTTTLIPDPCSKTNTSNLHNTTLVDVVTKDPMTT